MKRWALLAAFAALTAIPRAQEGVPRFSSSVELVEVYVTVTDASGAAVQGLTRDDFEVFEDGGLRAIDTFAAGEFPLTVALGVDRSFSMAGEKLRLAKQASTAFLRALRPVDRSMVVAIGNETETVSPLDSDRAAQIAAVNQLDAWSTTALYDAVVATLGRLDPEPGRQALVVFSDGVDRYSQATPSEVVDRARRSRSLVYPVVLGKVRPPVIAELAVVSGGRSFQLEDARQLEPTLQTIARELCFQYLLGYVPAPTGTQGWRSIRVGLTTPRQGLRVRSRDGYFSR